MAMYDLVLVQSSSGCCPQKEDTGLPLLNQHLPGQTYSLELLASIPREDCFFPEQLSPSQGFPLFAHADGLFGAKQVTGSDSFSQIISALPWGLTYSMLPFSYPISPGSCLKPLLLQTSDGSHWLLMVPPVSVSLLQPI